MYAARLAVLCLVGSVFAAGCSQTPTSPSSVSAPTVVGQAPQSSAPLPSPFSANPPRALGATRYLAFGDSITWGATSAFDPRFLFAAANGGYPQGLQAALNRDHSPQQFTVINEGLPGEMATNAVNRFRAALTLHRPHVVLLLEGVNDLNSDVSITRIGDALRQMLDAAAPNGIPVVIATMFQTYAVTDPDGHYRPNGAASIPALNSEIKRIAAGRQNVHLVDLEPRMRDRQMVGADGLHLTDAGFTAMASAFLAGD